MPVRNDLRTKREKKWINVGTVGYFVNVGAVPSRVLHRRLAVFGAVLGAAAAFASPAVAEDGLVPPATAGDALALAKAVLTPEPTVAAAETASASASETAPEESKPALPEVDELVAEAIEPLAHSETQEPAPTPDPAPAQAQTPAPTPEAPAPTAEAPAQAAPAPASGAATPAQALETPSSAPEAPPTAAPDPVSAPAAGVIGAVVQQTQPLNVNVSLRFESPGDNGPVSQVNAAVAGVVGSLTAPDTQYQPAETQYHAPSAPTESNPAPEAPPATENQAPPASESDEQWNWTWQWSCGDAIPAEIALPSNSLLPIWNWNWEWNCGGNPSSDGNTGTQLPSQYHAVASQYQPININISIRVLSPGNDGPVTQVNIAQANVAVTVNTPPVLLPPVTNPGPVTPPSSGGSAPVESALPAAGSTPPAGTAPTEGSASVDTTAADQSAPPVELAVEVECCTATAAAPKRRAADDGRLRRPQIAGLLGTAAENPSVGPVRSDTARASTGTAPVAPVSAAAIAALAPPQPAVQAGKRAKAQERLKRAGRKSAPDEERAAALGTAGVSPLATPDKSSKLFFLYLIPFALALVDAARRVLGEQRPTAADPGRPPTRPG